MLQTSLNSNLTFDSIYLLISLNLGYKGKRLPTLLHHNSSWQWSGFEHRRLWYKSVMETFTLSISWTRMILKLWGSFIQMVVWLKWGLKIFHLLLSYTKLMMSTGTPTISRWAILTTARQSCSEVRSVRDFCKKICQKNSLSDRKKLVFSYPIALLQHWLTVAIK